MYKIEFRTGIVKDKTYDDAYYSTLNNDDNKWKNYYSLIKEKYDLCYNVLSVTIDTWDIREMQFACFSNNILLKLYLKCKREGVFEKYDKVSILNDNIYNEELIYNILKAEWLIDERLISNNPYELALRKNYFQAMIEASESVQNIKIQFRNKLFSYFLETYDFIQHNNNFIDDSKVLKLSKSFIIDK